MENEKKVSKKQTKSKIPFYKKNKFKFSTFSTIIIAVFMVCLIAVNILASFLSERFSGFSIDLTGSKYSISENNVEYIKKIDKEISIIIASDENDFVTNTAIYADSYGYTYNSEYFTQTIELLKNYQKINSNITVKFIDSSTPEFNQYKDRYNSEIEASNIIVDRTYTDQDGIEKTKYKILQFEDLYAFQENDYATSYYGTSSVVSSSNVEVAVTSALYYVANDRQDKITVITGYESYDMSAYLADLTISGYDFEEIDNLTDNTIPEDTTMLMIAAPKLDFSKSDTKIIRDFLLGNAADNETFAYGKSLIYFASSKQYNTPNLDELLKEWGIKLETGTVYETAAGNYISGENTAPIIFDSGSEYSSEINDYLQYYTYNSRPMSKEFESQGKYNVYEVLNTSDTCVAMPYKVDSNWEVNDEMQKSYSSVLLSRFVTENPDKENDVRFSNVIAVSSTDFITTFKDEARVGNDELLLSLINECVGRVSETYEIENKQINYATFQPTEAQAKVIDIVIHYIIPVLVVVIGIVVYIIRKRR